MIILLAAASGGVVSGGYGDIGPRNGYWVILRPVSATTAITTTTAATTITAITPRY